MASRSTSSPDSSTSGSSGSSLVIDENVKPGEFVLQSIFLGFCSLSEKKIELVLAEPLVSARELFHINLNDYDTFFFSKNKCGLIKK